MRNTLLTWLEIVALITLWGCFLWKLNRWLLYPYGFALLVTSVWLIRRALRHK